MGGEAVPASPAATGTTLPLARLSPAEMRVFEHLTHGRSNREIADDLVLTEATVRSHLTRIYSKLEVRGRSDLLARLAMPRGAVVATPVDQVAPAAARPAIRGFVLAGAAAVMAVLAVAMPVTALITGPALLLAAMLLLRPGGAATAPSWLRRVLIGAAVLLCIGGIAVAVILVALLGSG